MPLPVAFADLVWSAAFHTWGVLGFVVVAAVLVVETPLLKLLLRTPWDDTAGAVFLGHLCALLVAWLVGVFFTEAMRAVDVSGIGSWGELLALPGTVFAAARSGTMEFLGWPASGMRALLAAVGFSSLVFLLTVRAMLGVPWSWRNAGAILGVSLLTALGIAATLYWTTREVTEAAPDAA